MFDDVLDRIMQEEEKGVRDYLRAQSSTIRQKVVAVIRGAFEASSIYQSIMDGPLYGELGIEDPRSTLAFIVNGVANATAISMNIDGMMIGVFDADFKDAFSSGQGSYVSINSANQRKTVPWLRWLLTSAGGTVVRGYQYVEGNFGDRSRTGQGIMVHTDRGGYQLSESGSLDDNWITEVAQKAAPRIEQIIMEVIDAI